MRRLLTSALVLSSFAVFADEPNPKHFLNTDVFELEVAADPQISPDGSRIVYVRRSNDIMTDRARSNLWIVDTDGGQHRPVVSGTDSYTSPRWSPDSTRLVYTADQRTDSVLELFVAAPDGGIVNASISGPLTRGGDVLNFAIASAPGSLEGCAPGTQSELFPNGMVGCTGTIGFPDRGSLCAPGWHVCSAEEWVERRGGLVPGYHYWTDDNLGVSGADGNCAVGTSPANFAFCNAATPRSFTPRPRAATSAVELAMMPATSGTLSPIASAVAAIRSRCSDRSSAWPSPVLPPAASPCTPLSISQSTWSLTRDSSITPVGENGVVKGAMMPFNSLMVVCR